uniref:ARAD1C10340p n=1 Tax=Blastobotrys adeninivorans TaxID=409370 RepID=A0A060SZR0_BLAAD
MSGKKGFFRRLFSRHHDLASAGSVGDAKSPRATTPVPSSPEPRHDTTNQNDHPSDYSPVATEQSPVQSEKLTPTLNNDHVQEAGATPEAEEVGSREGTPSSTSSSTQLGKRPASLTVPRKPVPLHVEPGSPFLPNLPGSLDINDHGQSDSTTTTPPYESKRETEDHTGLGLGLEGTDKANDSILKGPPLKKPTTTTTTTATNTNPMDEPRQESTPAHSPSRRNGSVSDDDGDESYSSALQSSDTPDTVVTPSDSANAKAKELAYQLFKGTATWVPEGEYACWLGDEGQLQNSVRVEYMALYDFSGQSILKALRTVCDRIHMRGESQQLNRVIESFSSAWVNKNPSHGFYDSNVVYTIAYALLLLNTDIHGADHSVSKKMTKSTFVHNTLETIRTHVSHVRKELRGAKSLGHRVSMESTRQQPADSTPTGSAPAAKRSSATPGSLGDITLLVDNCPVTPLSKEWEYQVETVLKIFYSSVSKEPLKLHLTQTPQAQIPATIYSGSNNNALTPSMSGSPSLKSGVSAGGSILGRMSLTKLRSGRNYENQSRLSGFGNRFSTGGDRADSFRLNSMGSTFSFESSFSNAGVNRHGFAGLLWSSMIREDSKSVSESIDEGEEPFGDFEKIEQELAKEVELELLGAPWAKEGLLRYRPYIDPNTGKRYKKKDWKQVFVVVQRGQIKMFQFDTGSHASKAKAGGNAVVGAGNWLENAEPIDGFNLCHTLAQEHPAPKTSKGFSALWSLTLPQRGLLVFQAGTQEIAQEYVYTCNYWAGRLSKEPFEDPVSSQEFGWGILSDDKSDVKSVSGSIAGSISGRRGAKGHELPGDRLVIKEWRPSGHSLIVSDLNEEVQLNNLKSYIDNAEHKLDEHNKLRTKMSSAFTPGSINWNKAHSNWERKSQYLLQQVIRYKTYVEALEKGVKERKEKQPEVVEDKPDAIDDAVDGKLDEKEDKTPVDVA